MAHVGFQVALVVPEAVCQYKRPKGSGFNPWVQTIPWRRKWQRTPALSPGKSHGRRSLIGYSPWGCKESDTTERLHFRFHRWDWICTHHTIPHMALLPHHLRKHSISFTLLKPCGEGLSLTLSKHFYLLKSSTEAPFCPKLYTSLWGFHGKQSWPS